MADLLAQPRAGHCRHGPVRRSNYRFRPALCLRHRPARPQRPCMDQRHDESHVRVGRASNDGGVSLERGSALRDPGPRSDLWCRRHTPTACHGYPGQGELRKYYVYLFDDGETKLLYSGEEVAKEFGSIKTHGYFMRLLCRRRSTRNYRHILTLLIAFLTITAAISAGPTWPV